MNNKFKIKTKEKEEYLFRNIRFSKELFERINCIKPKDVTFTKFVIEACKYALDNIEK